MGKLSSAFEKAVTSSEYSYGLMNFTPHWEFISELPTVFEMAL
jgi:hypothetical protein